jgi:hypothetical protein
MFGFRWSRIGAAGVLLAAGLLAGWYAVSGGGADDDYYETIRLAGARIGWAHTVRETVREDGQKLVRTRNESQITLARSTQTSVQKIVLTCWETPDGKLVRFAWEQDQAVTVQGRVENGRLTLTRTIGDRSATETYPWRDWGGYFAPNESLRRKPLEPGEKRVVRSLSPITNVAANTKLEAIAWEDVELPGGKQKLLKIRGLHSVGQQEIETLMWVDRAGQTLRTVIPSLDQEALRTTKEEALRPAETPNFAVLLDTVVKLPEPPPNFAEVRRVVYLARLKSGKIDGVFSSGASQHVGKQDEHSARLVVISLRPDTTLPEDAKSEEPAAPEDLASTFLQSDDAEVQKIASSIAAEETDPWQVAVALRCTSARPSQKGYRKAFSVRRTWPARWKGIAPSTPCCWRPASRRGKFPPAWHSAWFTCRRWRASPITCGPKRGSRAAGCPWMPRKAAAALAAITSRSATAGSREETRMRTSCG